MAYPAWGNPKERRRARRCPEATALYRIVYNYHELLALAWEAQFQARYGVLRDEVREAFHKYLDCGILLHGCARAVCEECRHTELIAFSCKRRGLCPSCDAKRALIFAEHLHENVLLPYPHSHLVFSIPKRLRPYFKFNRQLLRHLYRAAWSAWQACVSDALPGTETGAVMALHTAGDLLNFHPHIHALALQGGIDESGSFHPIDSVDTEYLSRVFAEHVFEALRTEELLDSEAIAAMQAWRHSGFHAWVGEPVEASDSDKRQFLARYLKKSPVMHSRIELIHSGAEPIVRLSKASDVSRDFAPLEFLALLQAHIPDLWEQTTRYFGCYATRTRGAKRLALGKPGHPELEPAPKPSASWARCMKKVFEFDPLLCPACGGTMKIKAFITDSSEIQRLSKNIGVIPWRAPPRMPLPALPDAA